MTELLERITINAEQCGGRARAFAVCELRVVDVLDLLAAGLSADEILKEMPDLEMDDIKAALQYAARQLDPPLKAT
jgi:uncharacterized protein (DUF433 family)